MSDLLADFYVHRVTVRPLIEGPWGDEFGLSVDVDCFIDETRVMVRDGNGSEVIAEATITAPLSASEHFTPGASVEMNGRTAYVIKTSRAESGPLDLPDHTEVYLA